MGAGSKIVVSGDPTQTDLPSQQRSGLDDAVQRLRAIKGVKIVELTRADIVRHRLVQQIVEAYEADERGSKAAFSDERRIVRNRRSSIKRNK
jgi:phosphate starvation-inducible PhoH-like protein